MIESLSLQL